MTNVHRIVYGGICEIWVESDGRTITKILAATADGTLVGKQLDDLPTPQYVESKLMAGYADVPRPGERPAPHTYDGRPCYACGKVHMP